MTRRVYESTREFDNHGLNEASIFITFIYP